MVRLVREISTRSLYFVHTANRLTDKEHSTMRSGGREAEGNGLLNRHTVRKSVSEVRILSTPPVF